MSCISLVNCVGSLAFNLIVLVASTVICALLAITLNPLPPSVPEPFVLTSLGSNTPPSLKSTNSTVALSPAPIIVAVAFVYCSPVFSYWNKNNSSATPPANALSTIASFIFLLFTVPASGVSKGSLPSATDPKLPY